MLACACIVGKTRQRGVCVTSCEQLPQGRSCLHWEDEPERDLPVFEAIAELSHDTRHESDSAACGRGRNGTTAVASRLASAGDGRRSHRRPTGFGSAGRHREPVQWVPFGFSSPAQASVGRVGSLALPFGGRWRSNRHARRLRSSRRAAAAVARPAIFPTLISNLCNGPEASLETDFA